MNKNKSYFLRFSVLIIAMLTLLTSGSLSSIMATEAASVDGVNVVDMVGREVVLPEEDLTKVVILDPSNAEILFALDAGDVIIGRGMYVDYPAEVDDIPLVGTGDQLNVEEIIALEPQAVIMSTMGLTGDQLTAIETAGIAVIITEAWTIEEVYDSIKFLGSLVGRNEEAENLIADMEDTFLTYSEMAEERADGSSIYYEISPLEYGLWSGGQGAFLHELGELLGLENIFADQEGWFEVSEEQVLAAEPDYIITTMESFDEEAPSPTEEIMNRPAWEILPAVQNGNVYQVDNSEFTRPGPRLAEAIETLYDYIYGAD